MMEALEQSGIIKDGKLSDTYSLKHWKKKIVRTDPNKP